VTLADVRVPEGRIRIRPHGCFACGTLNTHGLHLELHAAADRCWTELVLPERFAGWEDIAHGGIVTTILDEVMAWALVERDHWGVTARIAVEFKKPVPIGRLIRGEGWLVEARRRAITAAGRLTDADGTILATSEALYIAAPDARKDELKARYEFRIVPDGAEPGDGAGDQA
jgi:acyl-coenzyme A thioesterase PaaI-like protein